jgi:iron complex transport system ATP-binding protein
MENDMIYKVSGMTIGHGDRILCKDMSFEILEGECIMLCGANGSGKTTLMRRLSSERHALSCEIAMIPARIPKVKGFTLREFIRISCFRLSDASGKLSKESEAQIDEVESRLSLTHLDSQDISTLSDGEFQKACIASALVRRSRLILLDEPTAFLDAESRISVLQTLRDLTRSMNKPAVLFSTHDIHDGLKVADRVFAIGSDCTFHVSDTEASSKESVLKTIFPKLFIPLGFISK